MLYKDALRSEQRNATRRQWAGQLAGLYENLNLSSFHAMEYEGAAIHLIDGESGQSLIWEEAAALMDTFMSKICALDEPKPQVMVTDGTYSDKRTGAWLDRFILGQYSQPFGIYSDLWDLWRHAFLVAVTATGTTAVKFTANEHEGRLNADLVDTLDMWCDDWCGNPLTWGEVSWVDAEQLCALYPDHEDVIWKAARSPRDANPRTSEGWGASNLVRLAEGWRVKVGNEQGVYCATIEGTPLEWDEYPYPNPPHVFLTPKRRLKGVWGRPVLQMVQRAILEENRVINAIGKSSRKTPQQICYFDPNVVERAKLALPKEVILIPYDSTIGPPPSHIPPAFMHQNSIELIDLHGNKIHDIPGLPEMHTAAKKPQGIEAAVAIRAVEGMLTERHGPAQRAFNDAVTTQSAIKIARACKRLSETKSGFLSTWKGQGFLKTIPAKDVMGALENEKYTFEVQGVSGTKNTPADRLQNLWDMMNRGIITPEGYEAARKTLDTYGETKRFEKQRQFISMQLETLLDSSPSDLQKPGFYTPPDKWIDAADAIAQVSDEYWQARMDDAPEHVTGLLLTYLTDLSDTLDAQQLKAAQVAGVSRGAEQKPAAPLPPQSASPAPQPAAAQTASPAAAPAAAA